MTFARDLGDPGGYWGRQGVEVRDKHVDGVEVVVYAASRVSGVLQLEPRATPPLHRYAALRLEPFIMNAVLVAPGPDVEAAPDTAKPWAQPRAFEFRGVTPGRYFLRTTVRHGQTTVQNLRIPGRSELTPRFDGLRAGA